MDYAYGKVISREEQKIWDELEYEIEKELEEEIKDGLLMLARRLQILYQHKQRSKTNDEATDLSIVIKLGIDCDIDIKEGSLDDDGSRPYTPHCELCLNKKCGPSSHSISQFGSSKSSVMMSKYGSVICTSKPLRKECNKGKVAWKY